MNKCIIFIVIIIFNCFELYAVDISIHQASYDKVQGWKLLPSIIDSKNIIFINPESVISTSNIASMKLLNDDKHSDELYLNMQLKADSFDKFNAFNKDNLGKWAVLMIDGKVYVIFKIVLPENGTINLFGSTIQKIQKEILTAIDSYITQSKSEK